ncbi:TPA: deaminase [Legionella pneumophila]|uniref:deaminase n=2 Tax=Legionella pneumophila TaxID=446 RepID=UPI000485EBCF|nr:nucleoside deaminase [Legionella pneumophila]ANH13552.1 tRNA-specific adenosine deaminase [Legionella pneumophila]ANH16516.1 tRNA-specific adenosine deaminase [Legionella pneumophila]ANH19492.1 tRNA-specific adenosine deaminase [Legionella pneumophila]APX20368.1 tRNA-specific adenosine deaminase [Legionella pneumophila]AQL12546.1 tRNA-specific adenosine deaminase [Legionella pneumophila]
MEKNKIIDKLLAITEQTIVPMTQKSILQGNKIFGAAILNKADLSLIIASTNHETENPLWHGEIHTLKKFYEIPKNQRPLAKDCLFFSTHEPCSLCLSAITWGGYDNFYYLFDYYDTRDLFHIPHDLKILKEVFNCDNGRYSTTNSYWTSYYLLDLINSSDVKSKSDFLSRVAALKDIYNELSEKYQIASKLNESEIIQK